MAIIYSYPLNFNVLDTDIVVGTSTKVVGGKKKNFTKSFSMLDIYGYIVSNLDIQAPNLQEVTTTGNITTLDISVNGLTIGRGSGSISSNTAVGDNALKSNLAGNSNTASGFYSLFNNTNGSDNTANGDNALFNNTTGSFNIGIGSNALLANASDTNSIIIGSNLTGLGSNTTVIGTIGTTITRLRGAVRGGSFVKDGGTSLQYLMADGSVSTGDSIIPTLQQVTTAGATTTNPITINSTDLPGLTVYATSVIDDTIAIIGNGYIGVYGNGFDTGVLGFSIDGTAVKANTNTGIGVFATTGNGTAVYASAADGTAIYASSNSLLEAVVIDNADGVGLNVSSGMNTAIIANTSNENGIAIIGTQLNNTEPDGVGVKGVSQEGTGVYGDSANGIAVYAASNTGHAVYAQTNGGGTGVIANSVNGIGVFAFSSNGKSLISNISIGNTSNIAEFQKGNINQASISHDGKVTANAFIKIGGTSSQYLMANGSVTTGVATPTLQAVTEVGDTTNIGIKVIGLEKYISVASQDNETGAVTISTDAIGLPYIQLGLTANENTATFRADNINTNSVYQLPNSSGTMALTSDVNNRLVVERTTGYTLTNADSGGIIIFKTTAAQTLNIPLGLDAGFECTFVTLAGITLTVPSVVGITLNNATGTTMAGGLSFTLKRMLAIDTFIVTGNL